MDTVFGIDLGTTFSVISSINEFGKPEIYSNEDGDKTTPSVILFEEPDSILVGKYALENAPAFSDKTARFIKREMGKSQEEFSLEFFGKKYSAPALSAIILSHLKRYVEKETNMTVKDVVITVPAYFNNKERNATMEAAKMAGLNPLEIINEPTAAAFAFGIDKSKNNQKLFVFDLGGGTFDVSIVQVKDKEIQVLASDGDHRLGGVDWDNRIVEYASQEYQNKFNADPVDDMSVYQDLVNRANSVKHNLSRRKKDTIQVTYQGETINVVLTREKFEEITNDLLKRCEWLVNQVLENSKLSWSDIDQVLMIGGSTRMPMVLEMMKQLSGKEPNTSINPDEAVSVGAAYRAALLNLKKENRHRIPEKVREKLENFKTVDVNSHTLGCELLDVIEGKVVVEQMIKKNEKVPCEVRKTFGTVRQGQQYVSLPVLQGESKDPDECRKISDLELGPLPSNLPPNTPVNVQFIFNNNNILEVYAECEGVKAKIKITEELTHSEQEIEEMRNHIAKMNIE